MALTDPRIWKSFICALSPLPGEKVLDVGAGTGEVAAHLTESTGAQVCAVDPNARRIASARRAFPSIRAAVAPAERLPFQDAEFDRAYTTFALHHFADMGAALGEISRVLKPEATFVVLEVKPNSGLGMAFRFFGRLTGEHTHMMGEEQLVQTISAFGLFNVRGKVDLGSRFLLVLERVQVLATTGARAP